MNLRILTPGPRPPSGVNCGMQPAIPEPLTPLRSVLIERVSNSKKEKMVGWAIEEAAHPPRPTAPILSMRRLGGRVTAIRLLMAGNESVYQRQLVGTFSITEVGHF